MLDRKPECKKATGHDGILAKVLKISQECIAPVITKLFNRSIKTCIFPDHFKKVVVNPIHKSQIPLI